MLLMQRAEGLFAVRKANPERFLFGKQRLDGFDADRRVEPALYRVEKKGRSLVGIEARHPCLEIDVTNGEIGIIDQRGVVAGNASFAIGEVAVPDRVEYALGVEAKHRPSRKVAWVGYWPGPQCIENANFKPDQFAPPNGGLDGTIKHLGMMRVACLARFCASHPSSPTVFLRFTWTDVVMPLSLSERDPAMGMANSYEDIFRVLYPQTPYDCRHSTDSPDVTVAKYFHFPCGRGLVRTLEFSDLSRHRKDRSGLDGSRWCFRTE